MYRISVLIIRRRSNKLGITIPQVANLPKNISKEGAVALETQKIYNCLTWTSLMTILLDAAQIQSVITLLTHEEWNIRTAGADALLKLSEKGNILSFCNLNLLMYYS